MSACLQLYSMRDHPQGQFFLKELSNIGIDQVEGYAGVYGDPSGYRMLMDDANIQMPSGHMGLNEIEADFAATLSIISCLGIGRVFAPYLEPNERPDSSDGYMKLARRLNEIALRYRDHGLSFGWHNHDFEFMPLPDGRIPMEVLLEHAPDIGWEADLAWIAFSGQDPEKYIDQHGHRLLAVHVKDIAAEGTNLDQDGWANLGMGRLYWEGLLRKCRRQSSDIIYVLEHDKPSNPLEFVKQSSAEFNRLWELTND